MPNLEEIWTALPAVIPFLITVAAVVGALIIVDVVLKRRDKRAANGAGEGHFGRHIIMLILTIIALVVVILAAPVEKDTSSQLIGLLGVAITAVIALASTTFVSNAMAGILLRSMSRFRPGDFVRVGDHIGRVTERGLFHTEVQTEDRDLVTLPNFYLISNPLKVVRASGTIISATVSLGYDVGHDDVRRSLLKAAETAGLADGFVHVIELGDFSIVYRVAGFLEDVKQLIPAQAALRSCMLDALHADDIEIVSPTFMVQRPQTPDTKVMARPTGSTEHVDAAADESAVMFDKAEAASRVAELQQEREALLADIEAMKKSNSGDDAERDRNVRGIRYREQRLASIDHDLAQAEESLREDD